MRQILFFLLIVLQSLFWYSCTYKVLKVDRFLEKNEMAKAKKRIDKAIEKTPENLAAHYMLARYYSHPVWSYDAVDSAHQYIQSVGDSFPKLDIEIAEKLAKKGLDSVAITKQAIIIDSLAFEKALSQNSEEAYNQYLQNYQYLIYKEKAKELRNQVAYEKAIAQNTTQAVSEFFRKYPNAPQAQKARNVFETLYYEKKTQNQKVEEYKEYLEERPETEFAEEAASHLLNLISAGAKEIDYQQFIEQYSRYEASAKAELILEGLNYKENTTELITYKKDSLFYFYNLEKGHLLPFQFDEVTPDSCSFLKEPFILRSYNNSTRAYLKNGEPITDYDIKSIEYLGSGFFKLSDYGRKQNLAHFSLIDQLNQEGLDFSMLDKFHLAKKQEDGWYLTSILGEPILKQPVDSIWKEKEVYFFKKGKDMAVASLEDFRKTAKGDVKSLSFLYDAYEWLGGQYLRLYSDDYETIFDSKAQLIFPLEKAKYDFIEGVWLQEKQGEYIMLDSDKRELFEEKFDDYRYRSRVLALQKDKLWSVFNNGIKAFPKFQYDSVRIFNDWLTLAIKDSTQYLLFNSDERIKLEEGEVFKILKNYNIELSDVADQLRFVEVSNEEGYFKLFNAYGRKIKEGEKLGINILTPQLIQIHQNKKKQLIDSSGNLIELRNVTAFGAYQDGLIPILQDKKFGALRVDSMKVIPAHSQSKLGVFLRDSLYIFKEDNLLGISDSKGEALLEADFESIEFFNDSTAIVEEKGEIGILNIYQNEYLHEGIDTWEKVFYAEEQFYIIRKKAGYGVLNQLGEEIIPFIFNELTAYKSKGQLYWLAERRLSEINYIVIAYFDKNGSVLFKEGLNFDDYLQTACD